MYMIAINGEVGAGKTWLARRLKDVFKPEHTTIRSARDEIWDEVRKHYSWAGAYEEFKAKRFPDGTTGRNRMIEYAEMRQQQDPGYWIKRFALNTGSSGIIINDSLADPVEQLYLYSIPKFAKTITIVIAPQGLPLYGFYGDNYRRRVYPMNGFQAPDSQTALAMCDERLNNPPIDSIWHEFHVARLMVWQ